MEKHDEPTNPNVLRKTVKDSGLLSTTAVQTLVNDKNKRTLVKDSFESRTLVSGYNQRLMSTILCYAMQCFATLCYAMLCYSCAMLRYAMLRHATLCYALLGYAIFAMLRYAMLRYAILPYATLCYAC